MKTLITASTILDRLRDALQLSKDIQLAEFLGVSAQAIYQARKKDKVPDGWLIRAAQQRRISIDALLGFTSGYAVNSMSVESSEQGAIPALLPSMHQATSPYDDTQKPSAQNFISSKMLEQNTAENTPRGGDDFAAEFCTIPLVAAKLSAGGGSLETEGLVLQRMAFRKEWLQRRGHMESMVLMRVYGDSMEPHIQDGDLALIDTSQKNIIPYAVYAVGVDDGIYIKAIETLPGQRLILRSYNDRYSPIDIDMRGDLAESVRIIGKVLWWCHEA